MKILILDDDLNRHELFKLNYSGHELTHVCTAAAAIESMTSNIFDVVFLDHDLGGRIYVDSFGEEQTGYTVAKWLGQNPDRKPRQIFIHSFNTVGARNMHNILPGSVLAPGCWAQKQ